MTKIRKPQNQYLNLGCKILILNIFLFYFSRRTETDSKNVAETGHVTGVNANDPAHVNAVVADHVTVEIRTVLDALDVTEFTRRLQTFYYRILMGWVKKKKQTVDI